MRDPDTFIGPSSIRRTAMRESATEFAKAYIEAMNRHDVAALMAFFADEATYEDAAMGIVRRGRAQIEEFINFFFHCYDGVTYTLRNTVGSGDSIAWEWTLDAKYARTSHTGVVATGQNISVRGASFVRLHDGKVVSNTDYWDIGTMRSQIESGSVKNTADGHRE
jgi:steroid delta-isomerase-like uncharacterized protein